MVIVTCKFLLTYQNAFNFNGKSAEEFFADYAGDNGIDLMGPVVGGPGYRVISNFVCKDLDHAKIVLNSWFDRLHKDCGGYPALDRMCSEYLNNDAKWTTGMTIGIAGQMAGYSVMNFANYTAHEN